MKTTQICTGSASTTLNRVRIKHDNAEQWLVHSDTPEQAILVVSKICNELPVEHFFIAGVTVEEKQLRGGIEVLVMARPKPWRGITRLDQGRVHTWFIRGYRNGIIHTASFPDGKYAGSPEAAFMAAQKYRDRLYSRLATVKNCVAPAFKKKKR